MYDPSASASIKGIPLSGDVPPRSDPGGENDTLAQTIMWWKLTCCPRTVKAAVHKALGFPQTIKPDNGKEGQLQGVRVRAFFRVRQASPNRCPSLKPQDNPFPNSPDHPIFSKKVGSKSKNQISSSKPYQLLAEVGMCLSSLLVLQGKKLPISEDFRRVLAISRPTMPPTTVSGNVTQVHNENNSTIVPKGTAIVLPVAQAMLFSVPQIKNAGSAKVREVSTRFRAHWEVVGNNAEMIPVTRTQDYVLRQGGG